ncbi:GNAT family N-acetyltransferase [Nocardia sp. NPDC052566]|uniref:GNAT family N-acetyltransferase n=1 Tax=Nocardia sp. NPDC052566 TaxID=3364330 RepID=UPI0037CA8037
MSAERAMGLFAGVELSRRVDRAEQVMLEEAAAAATRRDPALSVLVQPIGGGLGVWAGPGAPFDKVIGVGLGGDFDDAELDALEQAYDERDAPVQFEVSTLADPAVVTRLTRRGYTLVGFENVLGLPLAPGRQAERADGVEIAEVGPAEFQTWVNVMVDGFAAPDTQGVMSHEEFPRDVLANAEHDMAAISGFVATMATVDGVPAGVGAIRLADGLAQLCGAATLPRFRRRGVQYSLLSTRLAAAAAAGCDLAVVTTLPGSKSQQNVQNLGFQLLYARAVLVRAAE